MMQEQEDQDIQPESGMPVDEPGPEVVTPLEGDHEVEAQPRPKRRLRKVLLWVVGLVIIFAAGVVLSWVVKVQPQAEQIATLNADSITAQDQVAQLNQELQELRPLAALNSKLTDDLSSATAHLDLLKVLVDVSTAQLALAQEDDIAARAALTGTDARLKALAATLEGANAIDVGEMSGRLELVLEEVESDTFAARRDLEILAKNLLALERVLFGE
jgi:cytoskeletal protein RodZ